jgi:O-antigen ligase
LNLDPLLLLLAFYAAIVFASSLLAVDSDLADDRVLSQIKGLATLLILLSFVRTAASMKRVVWALVLAGAALGTISLYQVLTGTYDHDFLGFGQVKIAQTVGAVREPRIAGPLPDPNFYAQVLVALVPLALYRLWDERDRAHKLAAAYALGVITLSAVFTYSRGGALVLALVFVVALVHRRVRLRYVAMVILALAPISLLAPPNFTARLATITQLAPVVEGFDDEKEDASFRQRRMLMAVAWEMFSDHPLTGVGAGNYTEHFDEYARRHGTTVRSYEEFSDPHYPHSTYLEILAETGVVGLAAFLAVIAAAFAGLAGAYRAFRSAGSTEMADLVFSVALAITAYLTTSLLLQAHYIEYLWLLVALAGAARSVSATAVSREVARR